MTKMRKRIWSGCLITGDGGGDAQENLEHLRKVHGHDEGHELLDTRVDGAALLDRLDDGAEVVIGEDHIGGTLGDLGTFETHGDTDVGAVERGSVVDAVAGHRAGETGAEASQSQAYPRAWHRAKTEVVLVSASISGLEEVLTLLVGTRAPQSVASPLPSVKVWRLRMLMFLAMAMAVLR